MDDKKQIKEKLLNMYKDALEDASLYYKSDYSYGQIDDELRDDEDAQHIKIFKDLLNLL